MTTKAKSPAKRTPKKSQSVTETSVESPAVPVTQTISTEDLLELLFLHLNRVNQTTDCYVWVQRLGSETVDNVPMNLKAVTLNCAGNIVGYFLTKDTPIGTAVRRTLVGVRIWERVGDSDRMPICEIDKAGIITANL